jgi:hypothetical protein
MIKETPADAGFLVNGYQPTVAVPGMPSDFQNAAYSVPECYRIAAEYALCRLLACYANQPKKTGT